MPFIENYVYYEYWSYPRPRRTITLINGYARSCSDFRSIGKELVKANFAVIVIDNRGVGRSFRATPVTLEAIVKDVLKVWEHLGVVSSTVLGISMGGTIAQLLSIEALMVVDKLILVSSFPDATFSFEDNRDWPSDLDKIQEKLRGYVAKNFSETNSYLLSAMAKQIHQDQQQKVIRQPRAIITDRTKREDTRDIIQPTLVIHGAEDRIIPTHAAETLAEGIERSQVAIIPSAGHLLLIEKPSELLTEIKKFCNAGD